MKKQSTAFALFVAITDTYLLYLGAQLLLAAAAVRTPIPAGYLATIQFLICAVAVLAGGKFAARRAGMGSMAGSLSAAGGFAALVLLSGFLLYNRIAPAGEGIRFLLAVLSGSILAGIPEKRKRKTMKRKRGSFVKNDKSSKH